jgi:hypothetical protein
VETQTRHISGTASVAIVQGAPTAIVQIPLFPVDGAFSVSGTLIAVDTGQPAVRLSVGYYVQIHGPTQAGEIGNSINANITTLPSDGGAGQGWNPGALVISNETLQLQIGVHGIPEDTIAWGYSLDIVQVCLP